MPLTRVIPMISSSKCRVAFSGRKPAGQRLRSLGYAFSLCVVSYVTLLANCGLPALAELPQNDIVHREEFVDVMGDKYRLPGAGESKAVVLLFVGYDCPISNCYAAEIVRLCKEFMPKLFVPGVVNAVLSFCYRGGANCVACRSVCRRRQGYYVQ